MLARKFTSASFPDLLILALNAMSLWSNWIQLQGLKVSSTQGN
jgi:hypothetical protein